MSFEMFRVLVQQRLQEGASPEAIRRELAGMGIQASDVDILLRAKAPEQEVGRESLSMWDFLPLIPMWLGPMAIIVMAAILERPKFAIGILLTGMIVHFIGKICMVILAFSEGLIWGVAWFFLQCFVEIMLVMTQPKKFWKVFACEFVGAMIMISSFFVDPKAVIAFLDIKIPEQEEFDPDDGHPLFIEP